MKIIISIIVWLNIATHAMFFPIFSYSDETGALFGFFSQQEILKSSKAQYFLMTQKKGQAGFVNLTDIPYKKNRLNVNIYTSNTGTSYYGVANTTTKTTDETLYFSNFSSSLTMEIPTTLKWDLLAGIKYNQYNEDVSKNGGRVFDNLNDIGIILGGQHDTRNSEYNSTSGYFNEIAFSIYPRHQIVSNDVRYFYPYNTSNTIAYRFYIAQTIGDTNHIEYIQKIGNYFYMRGYKSNDIVDNFLAFSQVEWRSNITNWLTLCPFIEVGTIGQNLSEQIETLFSYGFSTHFPLGTTTLRLELAFAETNKEFYFGFNHVF
jgi:hypothetical protein